MNATLLLPVVLVGLSADLLRGQDVIVFGSANCGALPAPVCQAAAPVIIVNQAPVVYQSPVVVCRPVSPNVIYFGTGCGYPRPNLYSGGYCSGYGGWYYPSPSVIYFGVGQAYSQGYRFGHCR